LFPPIYAAIKDWYVQSSILKLPCCKPLFVEIWILFPLKFNIKGFSGSLILNPISKFENSKWLNQYDSLKFYEIAKNLPILWNVVIQSFRSRWFRSHIQNEKILNGWINMANANAKISQFQKYSIKGYSGSPISYPNPKFENSKWRNQYGGWIIKLLILMKSNISPVLIFGVIGSKIIFKI